MDTTKDDARPNARQQRKCGTEAKPEAGGGNAKQIRAAINRARRLADFHLAQRLLQDWQPPALNFARGPRPAKNARKSQDIPLLVGPAHAYGARPVELRKIETPKDVTAALNDVLEAISNGKLTAKEGATITKIIEAFRKAYELIEIEDRVSGMERDDG